MIDDDKLSALVYEKIGKGRTLLQLTELILGKDIDENNIHHSSVYSKVHNILMSGPYSFYPITKDRDTPFWIRSKGMTKCIFPEDWFSVCYKHSVPLVDGECKVCNGD